jgi:hypothetical protein
VCLTLEFELMFREASLNALYTVPKSKKIKKIFKFSINKADIKFAPER